MNRKIRNKFITYEISNLEIEISKIKIENLQITHEIAGSKNILKENEEKLNASSTLPLLVSTISEIFLKKNEKKKKIGWNYPKNI